MKDEIRRQIDDLLRRCYFVLFYWLIVALSLYSAIIRILPLSQDKCAKLIPNQLRDLKTVLGISLVDNSCNLGDVAANYAGSLGILAIFAPGGYRRFQ